MLIKSTYVVYKQGNQTQGYEHGREHTGVDPDREGGNAWGIFGEVHTSEHSRKRNELMRQIVREREKERSKERKCTGSAGGYNGS